MEGCGGKAEASKLPFEAGMSFSGSADGSLELSGPSSIPSIAAESTRGLPGNKENYQATIFGDL